MIYEIICNETQERYIGSTFEPTLARRLAYHKSDSKKIRSKCSSKQIIGRGNYYINLLETVDTKQRDMLRMKEREWYDKLPNINKLRPFVTKEETLEYQKQLYIDNRENKLIYAKQYVQENYDKIQAYRQQYRDNHKEQRKAYDANRSKRRKEMLDPEQFT
jgi:hypothetical protein